jgi:hypothetical protein
MHRLTVLLVFSLALCAQDPRGSVTGRVLDSSGAAVPGADVRVVNLATQVAAAARTNETGAFNVPFLLPGRYRVTAEAAGFKKLLREGIEVRVSETVDLALPLEIGGVAETVEVKAESPVLDTTGASLGQVVDQRRIEELPIFGGNPLSLMMLAPGMANTSDSMPTQRPAWNNLSVGANGNGSKSNEFQIDGVSNTYAQGSTPGVRPAFSPPSSAVGEFKVQTTPFDATVGHTIGALSNVVTKGGANTLRGEARWWVRNRAFDAPDFFTNKRGATMPVYQDNRFGAAAGGPLSLPRLYQGRNRTFWFYAWELNKWQVPQTFTGTVPTAAQTTGDFSGLLAVGKNYQIYDPYNPTAAGGGRYTRQPFPNNVIPASRLDKVGANLVRFYPTPNQPGTIDGRTNYFNAANVALEDYYVHLLRLDHAFNENHRIFVRLHYDFWEEDKDHRFGWGNPAAGIVLHRTNKGMALDDVWVINPSLVLNTRYGLTFQDFPEYRTSRGVDLAALGFAPALVNLIDPKIATLPRITAGAYSAMASWESGDGNNSSLTHSLSANFNWLRNRHNMRFGADARVYRTFGARYPRSAAPDLTFSSSYTRGPLDNAASSPIGQELAAMLLGIPSGTMERTASFAMQDEFFALYFQDDLRLRPNLTLNLGLRYEIESPVTERYNRLVANFDFDAASPIAQQAEAAYALRPIPEIAASQFAVRGGVTFAGADGRSRHPYPLEKNMLLPRLGLAWQISPKTSLRAGFGLFYGSTGVSQTAPLQSGFAQSTPVLVSLDNGVTFSTTITNPFPNGLYEPLGAAGGLSTNLGQALTFFASDRKHPYASRWTAGVQRQLPGQFLLEANYVGNRGTRLEVTRNFNATPAQYLIDKPVRDQAAINYLNASVQSPFAGLGQTFTSYMSRANLVRPYPQFGDLTALEPIGYSWYHALQARIEKRYARGFTFGLGYTWSKLMEAVDFLNASDTAPYRTISSADRPHRITLSGIYELPFGRGRKWGRSAPVWLQFLAGGWQVNGISQRQSGAPLSFGNIIFNGDIRNIALPENERDTDRWFNTAAGFNRNSADQLASNIRRFPLRFAGVRGDSQFRVDLSALKNFRVRERLRLQFRAEAINALNHANFSLPDTNPVSSSFGRITGTAWQGRGWQFALRLVF